ncbi:MAG: alpha/beta fold hydrolase, partial [Nitriliruptorales bacterium]|nr:alpha/beta fold hydrolase [Nitriliruptorales bacterium]
VPSRPGYGGTPLGTGPSPDVFADVVAQLCGKLGIDQLAVAVGISAGGPTAVAMAARHPQLVQRLILQSAVGPLSWPDRLTRAAGRVLFNARTEALVWRLTHALLRRYPTVGLRLLLRDLTTLPIRTALAGLGNEHRQALVDLLMQLRSRAGFANDLRCLAQGVSQQITEVTQPTLVIATRADGSVPFAHAQALAAGIPRAQLLTSGADTHFIWFGEGYPRISDEIAQFLSSPGGTVRGTA